jgi:hypothetical protein
MNVLKRGWIPPLIVVVVAIAGFTIYRMHGAVGADNEITRAGAGLANDAKPFNPKTGDLRDLRTRRRRRDHQLS